MKYSPYINSFEDSSYYGEYLSGGNAGYPNIAYIIDSGDIEVVKTPTHDVFTIECSGNGQINNGSSTGVEAGGTSIGGDPLYEMTLEYGGAGDDNTYPPNIVLYKNSQPVFIFNDYSMYTAGIPTYTEDLYRVSAILSGGSYEDHDVDGEGNITTIYNPSSLGIHFRAPEIQSFSMSIPVYIESENAPFSIELTTDYYNSLSDYAKSLLTLVPDSETQYKDFTTYQYEIDLSPWYGVTGTIVKTDLFSGVYNVEPDPEDPEEPDPEDPEEPEEPEEE